MLTDDDLTDLLRRGFAQATADLDPKPDLVGVLRRRHTRARRRRVVVGVAIPAAALAAGTGFALVGPGISNRTPSHPAVAGSSPSSPATSRTAARSTPVAPARAKPASYKLVALKHHLAPPSNCPANATAPVGKSVNPAGVWFFTKQGTCVFVGIRVAASKPADAAPVQIPGYAGLYGTVENGIRTIYAPTAPSPNNSNSHWVVLTMPANAPQKTAVHMMIVPTD